MRGGLKGRIVIIGGGLGGLETAVYLRERLDDRAEITLISPSDTFVFKPFLTYVPFGLAADRIRLDLEALAKSHGFRLMTGRVDDIRTDKKYVHFGAQSLVYDYLVVATGATTLPEPIPGIRKGFAVWSEDDMGRLRERLLRVLDDARAGRRSRLLFLVPPGCAWPGPLYEIAFMTATWLIWSDARELVDIKLVTSEKTYVDALGTAMHDPIRSELESRKIEGALGKVASLVENGRVLFEDGSEEPFDLLVHGIAHVGASPGAAFPLDPAGFIRTRLETRQVVGHDDVYAVGDASDYPIKQGYLALLQADAAAEHIASRILGTRPGFAFDPSSLWMMEELDQALLAYSPGGDGSSGIAELEVGKMPLGRLRRVQMMSYLPRHSKLGNPLYAGLLWKGTEVGIKILAQLNG